MDQYHVWFDLAPGVRDTEFCDRVEAFLGRLREQQLIEGHRLSRRKLGFGLPGLGEFHIVIDVKGLAQLDAAFGAAAVRAGPVEDLHAAVNQSVREFRAALYRDFPDPQRRRGGEKF